MNVVAKLTLTVVMLAIGVAPALALHSDTFLPVGGDPPTREAAAPPSSPEADLQHEDPPAEGLVPITGIPQTEAEWNAWVALRIAESEAAIDPADAVGSPVGESGVDQVYTGPDPDLYGGSEVEPPDSDIERGDDDEDKRDKTGDDSDDIPVEDEPDFEGGLLDIL